jgi:hypothetical protein
VSHAIKQSGQTKTGASRFRNPRCQADEAIDTMSNEPTQTRGPPIRALTQALVGADDPQIMRIVALVDAMMLRGSADQLIEPLRQRLARLRPPRPLRFSRLMFYPLDLLVVPAARYRLGQQAIPRSALTPMADHIRLLMAAKGAAIEAEIIDRSTADTALISRLGRSLWPAAAHILADTAIPDTWDATELGDAAYRSLAGMVGALLAEAAALDTLCSDAATGLLPPAPEEVEAILSRVARANRTALPMMIAMFLDRLPETVELLPPAQKGPEAMAIHAAMDDAAGLLLRQLDQEEGTEKRIAAGTLAEAGAAVHRIATLLRHQDSPNANPRRRDQLGMVRQRLAAGCKARFASGLQDELLAPLQRVGVPLDLATIPALESAARGLRVLETEGRVISSGSAYDVLLGSAADAIKGSAMRDRLALADQIRLVEILSGPDAALAMLDQSR